MEKKKNYIMGIWRVAYPLILYFIITVVVTTSYMFALVFDVINEVGLESDKVYEVISETIYVNTLMMLLVAALITIPIAWLLMRKDKKNKEKIYGVAIVEKAPVKYWVIIIGLALFYCLGGNLLIDVLRIDQLFNGYEEIAPVIYSNTFFMQIIAAGIAAPIVEELLFRGLAHRRIEEYASFKVAMIVSALLFAVYHMNVVQGIYAFGFGLIASYVMIKYKTIWAPILFHCGANIFSIVITEFGLLDFIASNIILEWVAILIFLAGLYFLIKMIIPMNLKETVLHNEVNVNSIENITNEENHVDEEANLNNENSEN